MRGKTTKEAKVELDFTRLTDMESMNGTTRNETDKIIRNKFGSIEDFFMTSMASQMDPLTFIKEGSTKRKEILAKFLDLDFFDKKFKLAKKDAAELRGIVKRMQDRDWASEVRKKSQILEEIRDDIDDQESSCDKINHSLEKNKEELRLIEHSISQIPTEVINISEVKENLRKKRFEIRKLLTNNVSNADTKNNLFEQLQRVGGLLKQIDIDDLTGKKAEWERLSKKRSETSGSLKTVDIKLKNNKKKLKLLDGIPCGDQFPKCKFICDANKAKLSIGGLTDERESLYKDLLKIDKWRNTVSIDIVRNKIVKHSGLLSNKRSYESSIKDLKHLVHKNISKVKLLENEVEALEGKERVYEENREAIENLETLMREQTAVNKLLQKKISKLQKCKKALQELYIEQGSTKQTIETLREKQKELEDIEREWVAYDLFMQCMHPNGIPYNIIKNKLPFLNEEISKILANIVDFEVFFENNDKKLDINIKHPFYDPRPLSMGSGAEKTLASMAIRLALISITNLPKSELFILDEPATALDHDHMEGFVRLLQMIKNQFKTVILISHLDSLKDVVDMAIDIEKIDGFAKVNI